MRRILSAGSALAVALSALVAADGDVRAEVPVDLELVLAIDVSGSVDAEEALLQRNGYLGALTHPDVIRAIEGGFRGAIAVAYVEWAGAYHRSVVVGWTEVRNAAGAKALTDRIARVPVTRGLYTSISGAIDFALPMFDNNGFEGSRRVIDVSGDGPNNEGRLVTLARDAAAAARVTVNGLPIVNDRVDPYGRRQLPDLDLYYRACVVGGPGAFMVVAEGFGAFAQAIRRKLIAEIAGEAPAGGTIVVRAPAATRPRIVPAVLHEPPPPLRLVAARQAPPCNIGELMLEQRRRNFNEN